jgi:glycosyltransferase involved in cell wall biosynthesis
MKILWIKTDFLHPTTRGGQIRTLEMLRRLHEQHEIHYVAFENPAQPAGVKRSAEYCTRAHPIINQVVRRGSLRFAGQVAAGWFSSLPVAVARYRSEEMRRMIAELRRRERFDSVVCDFLAPAPNVERMEEVVLFQHNVETTIWERHRDHAPDPLRKLYFGLQARRMQAYEGQVCRAAAGVVAVSEADAEAMRRRFGISRVTAVPTGVDLDYFKPEAVRPVADLVFIGSMDWMANIDGVEYFVRDVLPLIRGKRPDCTLAVVGRDPAARIRELGKRDPLIRVTGTVADVRPYLWGSRVSIVPLRVGGGTRLKIYESMAAQVPVVSTSVGAEGLEVDPAENIRIADSAESFAEECLALLEEAGERARMAQAGWELVAARFSWPQVARCFEQALVTARR